MRLTPSTLWRRIHTPPLRTATIPTALCIFAAILSSCSKQDAPNRGQGAAVPVVAAKVTTKAVPVELSAFGTVEPYASVAIKSEVGGILTDIHFTKGRMVKKGDLLFSIDPRSYQAALEQAQANLSRDQVQLENARREAARDQELLSKGVASKTETEKSQTGMDALMQAVLADQAAVDNAKLQVERCSIRSPIDGKTGNTLVDAGNLIKAGDATLVVINQVQPVQVFFSIPGRYLGQVTAYAKNGKLPVRAALPLGAMRDDSSPDTGELSFIDNAVDKDSSTILLGATFANKDQRLWPGQYVNVVLTLTVRQEAMVIPSGAVEMGKDGKYVFVIKQPDMTAEIRPVVAGDEIGRDIVIEQGLKVGETVVTDGQLRLVPNAKVEITTPDGGTAAASVPTHRDGAGRMTGKGARP